MGPQFIRFDKYGKVGAHAKNSSKRKRSMFDIAAEQVREPYACPHVTAPKPHIQRFGCDPREAVAVASGIAEQAVDARGRRLRKDAPLVLGGVISWPKPLAECLEDAEQMARWAAFRDDSIAWIHQYWGDHLMSVVEHVDEPQPHVQFIVVAPLDANRRIRLTSFHPGLRGEKAAAERGLPKREQKKAYRSALKDFQDNFYYDVASRHGLARYGKKRQRYERDEWMTRKKDREALAEASRRHRHQALTLTERAEVRANEAIALVQQDAHLQIAAIEAKADKRLALVTETAAKHYRNLATKYADTRNKLLKNEATISAQAAEIERLQERLRMIEAAPSAP
ncbi:hypothetical protein [Bradyrhizobium nanningense]|uniref:hypothetical protein n=1 Tax=Bradyrhizobium nanningense TaxID=1325118 RepID=UPI001008A525|nr:hypothetical protein [Bradyrhizobium nanningense]